MLNAIKKNFCFQPFLLFLAFNQIIYRRKNLPFLAKTFDAKLFGSIFHFAKKILTYTCTVLLPEGVS